MLIDFFTPLEAAAVAPRLEPQVTNDGFLTLGHPHHVAHRWPTLSHASNPMLSAHHLANHIT